MVNVEDGEYQPLSEAESNLTKAMEQQHTILNSTINKISNVMGKMTNFSIVTGGQPLKSEVIFSH